MNADELRAQMAALPALPEDADDIWSCKRRELRARLSDPDNDPGDFLTWPEIYSTMWVGEAPYIPEERAVLPAGWLRQALDTNDVHQLYHLWQWQEVTGRKVQDLKTIIEFGGGYGALYRLIHALGFRGEYRLVDTPEFGLLQAWWLSQHGLQADIWETGDFLAAKRTPTVDLLIAIRSLSETDEPMVQAVLAKVKADSYLFNYGGDVARGWLAAHAPAGYTWREIETPHLATNTYRIGWQEEEAGDVAGKRATGQASSPPSSARPATGKSKAKGKKA